VGSCGLGMVSMMWEYIGFEFVGVGGSRSVGYGS
jgi:hypothetical protein